MDRQGGPHGPESVAHMTRNGWPTSPGTGGPHAPEYAAPGSYHLLRHAMATHMLENGAELRYIQAMLGHSDYRATQIYTHGSIRKLQAVHALTHPAKTTPPSGTSSHES